MQVLFALLVALALLVSSGKGDDDTDGNWLGPPPSATTGSSSSGATVRYGTSSGSYEQEVSGSTSSYYESFQHDAVMTGLEAGGVKYYYIVGDPALGWSKEFSFASLPDSTQATPDAAFKFLLVGDMGLKVGNTTRSYLNKRLPQNDFILHIGDVGYADEPAGLRVNGTVIPGQPNPYYEAILDSFADAVEPLAAQKPYMVCPGNHDGNCDVALPLNCPKQVQNFTSYRARWQMPTSESNASPNMMWYSFNHQSAHIVSISSETDYPNAPSQPDSRLGSPGGPFGDQLGWLEADLEAAAAARTDRPWVIVFGHRPMYSGQGGDFPENVEAHTQEAFEPLFNKFDVDLYICGHNHAYETIMPMREGKICQSDWNNVEPGCTAYMVNGAAGNVERHSEFPETMPKNTMFFDDEHYGWSEFEVLNSTHLHYAFKSDEDGSTLQEGYLVKNRE